MRRKFVLFLTPFIIIGLLSGCTLPRLNNIPPSTDTDPYIRLSNHFDYAYEGHHIKTTRLVLLPDEPPNEWKSDPLQFIGQMPFILSGLIGKGLGIVGDEIERYEAKKAAKQLYDNLKSVTVIKDTELESRVLSEVFERLCTNRECLNEENADVQIVLEPIVYLSGNYQNIQMFYNLWAAMRDSNKPHMYKGGMVSLYYQSKILPVEKWIEKDWELLNVELEKAITETSVLLYMIVEKKTEEEIQEKMGDREIDFFQQQQLNCFTIRTFDPDTGIKFLYREWYFEYDRCMNARQKLEKRFEEL